MIRRNPFHEPHSPPRKCTEGCGRVRPCVMEARKKGGTPTWSTCCVLCFLKIAGHVVLAEALDGYLPGFEAKPAATG